MRTLNLPRGWEGMNFNDQQWYLVNSHQAKNLCDAARIITRRTNNRLRAAMRQAAFPQLKLWYRDA